MKTIEITKIVRGTFSSQVTICEVSETGERDGFEVIEVQHDSTTPSESDAVDIDAAINALSA